VRGLEGGTEPLREGGAVDVGMEGKSRDDVEVLMECRVE
jgi:hypothetical protein